VRRSSRFLNPEGLRHIQLDREPRRKKCAAIKTVYFSTVEDLKAAIITRSLDTDMEAVDVEPIQANTLFSLGMDFCGISPEELADAECNEVPKE
jgi:hypothetical protein